MRSLEAAQVKHRFPAFAAVVCLGFIVLRNHPVTYDIGRHLELLTHPGYGAQHQRILPNYVDIQILRYGLISLIAPAQPWVAASLLWILGATAFLAALFSARIWSKRELGTSWVGPLVLLAVALWGPRHTFLFGSHPYEIGLHFFIAAAFLIASRCLVPAILFLSLGMCIHPNLSPLGLLALLVLFKAMDRHSYFALGALLGVPLFYLGTSL